MMGSSFSLLIAIRHLRYGVAQTLLTIGVVASSVTLVIFLSSLIAGLQKSLIENTTGAIPHIVIKQPERMPVPAWEIDSVQQEDTLYVGTTMSLEQRLRKIEDWTAWLDRLRHFDSNITAVSPEVEEQAIMTRGARRTGVSVIGIIPERHNDVVDIQSKLIQGRFFGLNGGEAAIGYRLADDFDIALGNKLRLINSEGVSATYTVAGLFDTGFRGVDDSVVFVPLRDAQSLFGLGSAVTSIGLKLERIFEAEELANRLDLQLPYEAESWMEENQSLLAGLRGQTQSSRLILIFTTLATGFGIASILITAVVSKLREIGILKAMGATSRQIIEIFSLESTILAAIGGLIGAAFGSWLSLFVYGLRLAAAPGGKRDVFPVIITTELVVGCILLAIGVGFLASVYPSLKAARVDPIEVIRST
jgi:lipoprotein-releasing system permease protein